MDSGTASGHFSLFVFTTYLMTGWRSIPGSHFWERGKQGWDGLNIPLILINSLFIILKVTLSLDDTTVCIFSVLSLSREKDTPRVYALR